MLAADRLAALEEPDHDEHERREDERAPADALP